MTPPKSTAKKSPAKKAPAKKAPAKKAPADTVTISRAELHKLVKDGVEAVLADREGAPAGPDLGAVDREDLGRYGQRESYGQVAEAAGYV